MDETPEFQGSLFAALERTYREARTDKLTGGILTADEVIKKILTAYAIPPAMLEVSHIQEPEQGV